jgi:hypothetical protein
MVGKDFDKHVENLSAFSKTWIVHAILLFKAVLPA